MISETVISRTAFFDIDFYVSFVNAVVIIMIFLTRLNFHDFTFSIIRDALTKIIRKASSCLYSNNASNLALRDKRINETVTL